MSIKFTEEQSTEILNEMKQSWFRDKEQRDLVKAWADERGIAYNTRGKFPEKVFMAYIEENWSETQEVISSSSYRNSSSHQDWTKQEICNTVEIWCTACGVIHTHGGFPGQRGVISTGKVPHCGNAYSKYSPSYFTIVDNRPVEEWELKAVERNAKNGHEPRY